MQKIGIMYVTPALIAMVRGFIGASDRWRTQRQSGRTRPQDGCVAGPFRSGFHALPRHTSWSLLRGGAVPGSACSTSLVPQQIGARDVAFARS